MQTGEDPRRGDRGETADHDRRGGRRNARLTSGRALESLRQHYQLTDSCRPGGPPGRLLRMWLRSSWKVNGLARKPFAPASMAALGSSGGDLAPTVGMGNRP